MSSSDAMADMLVKRAIEEAREEAARLKLVHDDSYARPPPDETGGKGASSDDWFPPLTKTGMELFFCEAKYILAHGERGGGKSIAVLHFLMKHAYDNPGAAVCITTLTQTGATFGGAWSKLIDTVVPQWREGWVDPDGGWHEGMGLEGEGPGGEIIPKTDTARNRYFWIKAHNGDWSMFFLRSMMHGEQIQGRVKGMEFTAFFFDELTETDSEDYFIHPIQQLGRINGIDRQPYIGACNPSDEGEGHWVYKRFFQGFDNPADKKPKKRADYAVFHFPMTENYFMTPEQKESYLANVYEACRNDPTAEDRLLKGIWRAKVSGKGIFKDNWNRAIHVKGNLEERRLVVPRGRTIDIGYDIGTANTGIVLLQKTMTKAGEGWVMFDEVILVERYVPIPQLAPFLLKHMNYWCVQAKIPFHFNHIGDQASFNQMRPDGSYDARMLEECVKKELTENHAIYPGLDHLITWEIDPRTKERTGKVLDVDFRMVPCPKPAGSVQTRVRMAIARLDNGTLVVSAKCVKLISMFEGIESDETKGVHQPKRSVHIHAFDAATYPIYHHEMGGRTMGALNLERTSELLDLAV